MIGAALHPKACWPIVPGLMFLLWAQFAVAAPTYSCNPDSHEAELVICKDDQLKALDRKLADTYAAARTKTAGAGRQNLKAEQFGWIKGRNECWKSEDKRACIQSAYERRIAELQAFYGLVPHKGSFTFVCDNATLDEVRVSFYETSPATMIAKRGDDVSLMYAAPSASGAKYEGRNEMFWEHQGEARIVWGYQAPEMTCKPRQDVP